MDLQSRSLSSEKLKPGIDRESYEKGALIVKYSLNFGAASYFIAWISSASKLVSLPKASTASMRPTTDIMAIASRETVKYCQIRLECAHPTSKGLLMHNADEPTPRKNANICKNRLGNKLNVGDSKSSKRKWNPQKESSLITAAVEKNRSQHFVPTTQQYSKDVRSAPPPKELLPARINPVKSENGRNN